MAPDSLRNVMIPSAATGSPEQLCREVLAPLFASAQRVALICAEPDPIGFAQLTCGLGTFLRDGTDLTLLVISENAASSASERVRQAWQSALLIEPVWRRLSLYRWFSERKRLRILFRSTAQASGALCAHLTETSAFAVMSDGESTQVALLWKTRLTFEIQSDVSAEFRWSFGDPQHQVNALRAAVAEVAAGPSTDPEAERTLLEKISALPLPETPWEESFDPPAAAGFRLFPHQEAAVQAWFANGCHGIFKMCTGAGKTIAALAAVRKSAETARRLGVRPLPIIVTVPTRVLADQWCREIERFGFSAPLKAYNARQSWYPFLRAMLRGTNSDVPSIVVSTYCTFGHTAFSSVVLQLAQEGNRGIWIADEMHNLASPRSLDGMEKLGPYFSERLGLSATPEIENEEAKTRRFFQFFEDGRQTTCGRYELADGIKDGVLCRYDYHPFPQYLQPENSRRFMAILQALAEQEQQGKVDIDLYRQKREVIRSSGVQVEAFRRILDQLFERGAKTLSHTLIYCPPGFGTSQSDIDAAESDDSANEEEEGRLLSEVISILAERGVLADSIVGTTPAARRDQILQDFKAGEIQVLCAVACLDEGIDIPDIRRAIVLYSVNREKQFIQRRGRILRRNLADPGKVAEIHDVIILPQGSELPAGRADELLKRELRRYESFAALADNRASADHLLACALSVAAGHETTGSGANPE